MFHEIVFDIVTRLPNSGHLTLKDIKDVLMVRDAVASRVETPSQFIRRHTGPPAPTPLVAIPPTPPPSPETPPTRFKILSDAWLEQFKYPSKIASLFADFPVDKTSEWKEWATDKRVGLAMRKNRCVFLRKSLEFTLDAFIQAGQETIKTELDDLIRVCDEQVSAGATLGVKTVDQQHTAVDKCKTIHDKVADGTIAITPFHIFNFVLPPRRNEVAEFYILDDVESVDAETHKNYFVKSSKNIVFNEFKTAKSFGSQVFCLISGCVDFCFLDDATIQKASDYLCSFKSGSKLIQTANLSCDMRRKVGVISHDVRQYWATLFANQRDDVEKTKYINLCRFMAHSPATSRLSYVVPTLN